MKKLAIFLSFLFPDALAQQVEGEVELAGFVLGQTRSAVYADLGAPFLKEDKSDGWVFEFHKLKPDTSVYALFKYNPSDADKIYGIELVGDGSKWSEMHPFRGLQLGDAKAKVDQQLGPIEKTETVDDPPLITQYYRGRNYSVDIDKSGHLYGIQIFGNILEDKPVGDPSIKGFKHAIMTRNIDSLVRWISPDLEIHKGGKVVGYSHGARKELMDPASEVSKLLLGETGSVWYAFAKELADGTSESRMHPEINQLTIVDKFFDSNTLSEVVFRTHAGRWKVYEIKFR